MTTTPVLFYDKDMKTVLTMHVDQDALAAMVSQPPGPSVSGVDEGLDPKTCYHVPVLKVNKIQ